MPKVGGHVPHGSDHSKVKHWGLGMAQHNSRILPALSVYAGGLVIGLTLVSFPASSAFLKQAHGFSDAQYGAIYLPQLAAAVLGAVGGGLLTERLGMRALYLVSLVAFALAQLLLALSGSAESGLALAMVMTATACFGFGFGFGGGPLNGFAALLFPERSTTAVTALHMSAGAGLTVGPYLFATLAQAGHWLWGPAALFVVTVLLTLLSLMARFPVAPAEPAGAEPSSGPARSLFFWLCAGAAMIYSLAEGTFSNWAILYLHDERGLAPADAALALTAFWGALTIGRLLASVLVLRLSAAVFLFALPVLMTVAFLTLPFVRDATSGIAGFAFSGLACSAFFPMLVAFTASRFPSAISWIASMLTAAMMVGVGLGSYVVGAFRGSGSIASLYTASTIYPVAALILVALALGSAKRAGMRMAQ